MVAFRARALCIGSSRAVEALRAGGLTLAHPTGTATTHNTAVERLEEPVSLLVVAVKAPSLESALERVDPAAVRDAIVVPLLNGLEHLELIRSTLGATVVAGTIGRFEAFSPEPGFVIQRTPGAEVTVASDELDPDVLWTAVAALRTPTVDVAIGPGERAVLWEKAARAAVLAAATTASGATIGELRADPAWRRRLEAALAEAVSVAAAEGVVLDPVAQWAVIDVMAPTLTTSTARDVIAGRPSELDAITGAVVRAGRRHGVATPCLEALLEEASG